jgi:hypothetical protein
VSKAFYRCGIGVGDAVGVGVGVGVGFTNHIPFTNIIAGSGSKSAGSSYTIEPIVT